MADFASLIKGGQQIRSNQQSLQQGQQQQLQQQQLMGMQKDAQSILQLESMISNGATPQELLGAMSESIRAGNGTENLIDAANILQTQGIEGLTADLAEGKAHLQSFQGAGLIDIPALKEANIQSTSFSPGGVTTVDRSGQVQFQPFSLDKALADKQAEQERLSMAKASKLELEQGLADTEIKKDRLKLLNKERAARTTKFRGDSDTAAKTIIPINQILKLAEVADTGSFAKAKLGLKRLFKMDVANEEDFQAATNQLVLQQSQLLSGALSERDLIFLQESVAGLGKSTAGNIQIMKRMKALAEHARGTNRKFRKFVKNGGDPLDFEIPDSQLSSSGKAVNARPQISKDDLLKEILRRRGSK